MKWLLATFVVLTHALPNYCIHCKHFINRPTGPEYGKCRFFPIEQDSLVTGKSAEDYRYCSTARSYENLCGKKGKHYVNVDNFESLY
jgi:hypothetical protein